MQVIDGSPGITTESLTLLKLRATEEGHNIPLSLVVDEMSIRQQTFLKNGKIYGKVDLGAQKYPDDDAPEATNALVFMAVSLKSGWKLPVAYYLVKGLDSKERANILEQVLHSLHEAQGDVFSITFDGTNCNYSMLNNLGACFEYPSDSFRPYILHPVTNKKIHAFPDPPHCLKLVRNSLGEQPYMKDNSAQVGSQIIDWEHIKMLLGRAEIEDLHLANKITKKHVRFTDNIMNVRLAAQTLSTSTACALEYCRDERNYPEFQGSKGTQTFCENFNNAFDILNCRSKYGRNKDNYCRPIDRINYSQMQNEANRIIGYIENLSIALEVKRTVDGITNVSLEEKNVIASRRKAGFLGFIIALKNVFEILDALQQEPNLKFYYLLPFKLSQDHLESFFSAIRSRGGHNNNPNSYQFEVAYKHLLLHNEVKCSEYANVNSSDIKILHVSSSSKDRIKKINLEVDIEGLLAEIDSYIEEEPEIPDEEQGNDFLTQYVQDVVVYIAGFVARNVRVKIYSNGCERCRRYLKSNWTDHVSSRFLKLKNRGGLTIPSQDVIMLCMEAAKFLRRNKTSNFPPEYYENMVAAIISKLRYSLFIEVGEESDEQEAEHLDHTEHTFKLINLVLSHYYDIRRHHILTCNSMRDHYSRRKLTKFILFNNE